MKNGHRSGALTVIYLLRDPVTVIEHTLPFATGKHASKHSLCVSQSMNAKSYIQPEVCFTEVLGNITVTQIIRSETVITC